MSFCNRGCQSSVAFSSFHIQHPQMSVWLWAARRNGFTSVEPLILFAGIWVVAAQLPPPSIASKQALEISRKPDTFGHAVINSENFGLWNSRSVGRPRVVPVDRNPSLVRSAGSAEN